MSRLAGPGHRFDPARGAAHGGTALPRPRSAGESVGDRHPQDRRAGGVMGWLPGWSSAEGAGWWSQLFFWASMACLASLGVTQTISHAYGLRRAELAAIAGKAAGAPSTAEPSPPDAMPPGTPVARPSANPGLEDGRRLSPEQYREIVAG